MRLFAVTLLAAAAAFAQPVLPESVGPTADGGFALNSLWTIKPAGRQVPLDTLPINSQLSPDGRFLVVLHSGFNKPSVRVLSTDNFIVVDELALEGAWLGLCFAPGGETLYVSGGATADVYEIGFSDGKLTPKRKFSTVERGEQKTPNDFVGDVQVSPDGRLVYVAALFRDEVLVINPQSGWVVERFKTPRRPYRIQFHPGGQSFFVTSWAEGSIHQLNAADGAEEFMLRLGLQPMDMVWSDKPLTLEEDEEPPTWKARLFVTTANTNVVHVLAVSDGHSIRQIESIKLSPWPRQPLGITPSALALSKDHKRLYVVCSNANTVAAIDVSGVKSRLLGLVPTGWYPTAASALDDGRLVVLNGKGSGSKPNAANAPNPLTDAMAPNRATPSPGFAGMSQTGTASVIDVADPAALFQFTKETLALSPYVDQRMIGFPEIPEGNPIPPGAAVPDEMRSPIQHVLYIVKGGRSYDQVFGDLGKGNGEPSATIFGEDVAPNHRKLARDFVLFDNFYTNGDVSVDGRFWATASLAPAFIERLWPAVYSGRLEHYQFNHYELAAVPPTGFIWNQVAQAGLAIRNFGFAVRNVDQVGADGRHVASVIDPSLGPLTDRNFRGVDLDYPDTERAKAFLAALSYMESSGKMPELMVMQLANDQTSGTTPGKISARSAVADNDAALGQIVEACTKTQFWPRMAIFVVEMDSSGGGDHVDAHRSLVLAVSPYTRRGVVDSTFYNNASVLRTIELILGLNPMTVFDAAAPPLWAAFGNEPDPQSWESVEPKVSLTEKNP
jgi:DNA-binding beta-propeller fold protein YncE